MATTKKTTASKAASKTTSVAAHKHAELEAEIASLKKLVDGLQKELKDHCVNSEKEHAALAAKCDACCSAQSGTDPVLASQVEKIWKWLSQDRLFRAF